MNIFVSDICPVQSARNLDDKRVVKMCLETAQILSTALNGPYRPTHRHHPAVLWAAADRRNQAWLVRHGIALCRTYTSAFGREHASLKVILQVAENNWLMPEQNALMPLPDAFNNSARNASIGLDFTFERQVTVAYRKYLNARWTTDKRAPTWQRRSQPDWSLVPA